MATRGRRDGLGMSDFTRVGWFVTTDFLQHHAA